MNLLKNIRYFSMVHGVPSRGFVKDPPEGAYEVTTHPWSWYHHRALTKPRSRCYPSRALLQPFTSIMYSQDSSYSLQKAHLRQHYHQHTRPLLGSPSKALALPAPGVHKHHALAQSSDCTKAEQSLLHI